MEDNKAEKLAMIAVTLYVVSLLIFFILYLKKVSEGYISISDIFLIIAIPAYLIGLILAVIAKIKCKYSSFVDWIFRIYIFTTCGIAVIAIAGLVMILACVDLVKNLD